MTSVDSLHGYELVQHVLGFVDNLPPDCRPLFAVEDLVMVAHDLRTELRRDARQYDIERATGRVRRLYKEACAAIRRGDNWRGAAAQIMTKEKLQ